MAEDRIISTRGHWENGEWVPDRFAGIAYAVFEDVPLSAFEVSEEELMERIIATNPTLEIGPRLLDGEEIRGLRDALEYETCEWSRDLKACVLDTLAAYLAAGNALAQALRIADVEYVPLGVAAEEYADEALTEWQQLTRQEAEALQKVAQERGWRSVASDYCELLVVASALAGALEGALHTGTATEAEEALERAEAALVRWREVAGG